jgi:4-amino-4-deoxy-L-arabinose transferase-like glycosyltransferase
MTREGQGGVWGLQWAARPLFGWVDLFLAGLATLVGALVRWPFLQQIPRYSDETGEIQFALRITRDGLRPITSADPYIGPLHHYLMALGFRLGGGAEWPRVLVFLLGSLTVGLTYFLGASLAAIQLAPSASRASPSAGPGTASDTGDGQGDASPVDGGAGHDTLGLPGVARFAGLIAASLMAVALIPVVVNSHIAWSNSTTPFWTTLALLALVEARRRERPQLLVVAGVLGGLAQQTHPSVLPILLGGAAWIALSRPRWLRTRWPWLGLAAGLITVSNLIIYNVVSAGGSVAMATRHSTTLTGGITAASFLANARDFARMGYQLVASSFVAYRNETSEPAVLSATLRNPGALLYGLTALVAIVFTARRAGLALACWLAAALLLPAFNSRYFNYILARYQAPLLPPTFAAMACLLAAPLAIPGDRRVRRATVAISAVVVTLLLVYAGSRLHHFYAVEIAAGRTNARLWQIVDAARGLATADRPIVLDKDLNQQRLIMGGQVLKALDCMLNADGTPFDKERATDDPEGLVGRYLVIGNAERDALPQTIRLVPVDIGEPPAPTSPGDFWMYRGVANGVRSSD